MDHMLSAIRSYNDGKFRRSDLVTVKRNVLADIEVKVSMQTHLEHDDGDRFYGLIQEVMGSRSGILNWNPWTN